MPTDRRISSIIIPCYSQNHTEYTSNSTHIHLSIFWLHHSPPFESQDPFPLITLPETNIAPKNGWLEYYFPIGEKNIFRGYVSFREVNLLTSTFTLNKPADRGTGDAFTPIKPALMSLWSNSNTWLSTEENIQINRKRWSSFNRVGYDIMRSLLTNTNILPIIGYISYTPEV